MKKAIEGLSKHIQVAKQQQLIKTTASLTRKTSINGERIQHAYYGETRAEKTPFIGNKLRQDFYQHISKPLDLTVGQAYRSINNKPACLLDLTLAEEGRSYLRNIAVNLKLFTKMIWQVPLEEIAFNSFVSIVPHFNHQDAFNEILERYAASIIRNLFTICCDDTTTWPPLPLEKPEEATKLLPTFFNIDIHPYLYSMPHSVEQQYEDCYALLLKPREPFKEWLVNNNEYLNSPADDINLYDLDTLRSTGTAIIIPYLKDLNEADSFFNQYQSELFKNELSAWCTNECRFPQNATLEMFCDWFDFEYRGTALGKLSLDF